MKASVSKAIGIGISVFFICILITYTIAYTVFYMTSGVCVVISLVITALTLLYLCLHWRISRLEHQVEVLTRQFYKLDQIR